MGGARLTVLGESQHGGAEAGPPCWVISPGCAHCYIMGAGSTCPACWLLAPGTILRLFCNLFSSSLTLVQRPPVLMSVCGYVVSQMGLTWATLYGRMAPDSCGPETEAWVSR